MQPPWPDLPKQPFRLASIDVMVTASMGIAVAPRDGTDPTELFKNAHRAMYRAKETGRNNFRFFTPDRDASVLEYLQLSAGLRVAIQEGQLQLHYQPQIDLASGLVVGAEALMRWHHPTLGAVAPQRFIAIAEQSGLINELGAWALRQACRDARHWLDQGFAGVPVSVNVSSMQLQCGTIERDIATALAESGLPASALELELTESLLLADTLHFAEVLQRLCARHPHRHRRLRHRLLQPGVLAPLHRPPPENRQILRAGHVY
nr:EAL domain-containing protein [Melaminivora jejuensis]